MAELIAIVIIVAVQEWQRTLAMIDSFGLRSHNMADFRLWGDNGQRDLEASSICLIGSSAIATETLKSLILPGFSNRF
jgi:hypothetical protein